MAPTRSKINSMKEAYQVVFGCPNCHQRITVKRESDKDMVRQEIGCQCGWQGRSGKARLLCVVPFDWELFRDIVAARFRG